MPTDFDIFRAITSTWCLNVRCLSKIIPENLILLVSSIVADPILILVKCNSFLYEIIYFVLWVLIQIRFDVSQLLTLLSSLLRVNVNSRAFSSANEVDRVLSSANRINLNKDDEFGRSFINIRNDNGPRQTLVELHDLLRRRRRLYNQLQFHSYSWFLSLRYDLSHSCETPLIP